MRSERNTSYRNDETRQRVLRYESMKKDHTLLYFDVHEFEDIIDYYLYSNSLGSATEAVKIGLDQHPSSMTIQLREAQVLIDKGKLGRSLGILRRLSFIEHSNYEVFFLMGTIFSLKGDHERALQNYDKAVSLEAEDKAGVAYQAGMNLQARDRYADAIKYLKLSLDINPVQPGIMSEIAFCYEKSGDLDKAEKYYRVFLDSEPYSERGWYGLALVLSAAEKYTEALDAYDFVLAINDDNSLAYFNKANVLFLQKKFREAAGVYAELLEFDPDDLNALLYSAECYEELGDYVKAEHFLLEARKVDPDSAEAYYGMGLILMKKGKINDSRRQLRKAISLDKENAEFWFALSRSFQIESRYDSALNAINKAVEYDSFSEEYWLQKINIQWEAGMQETALETLKYSFQKIGESALIHYKVGIMCLKASNFELGLYHVEQGLILDYNLHTEVFEPEIKIFSSKEIQSLVKANLPDDIK